MRKIEAVLRIIVNAWDRRILDRHQEDDIAGDGSLATCQRCGQLWPCRAFHNAQRRMQHRA